MHRKDVTPEVLINFEDQLAKFFLEKHIRVPVHLCGSPTGKYEKTLCKLFRSIKDSDYVFSTHRNHYHYILKTGDLDGLQKEMLGTEHGVCKGCSGSMHTISVKDKFYSSAIVAGCVSIALGTAWALKDNKSQDMVWCFVGDGATDSGWFSEALRYAQNFELPITYVIEDNNRSVCTDVKARWGWRDRPYNFASKVRCIEYNPKWPHVGCGEWVTF